MRAKLLIAILTISFLSGCVKDLNEHDVQLQENRFEEEKPRSTELSAVDDWMDESNIYARFKNLNNEYDLNNMVKVIDKDHEMQILTIVNDYDGNKTLCFSLDKDGNVATAFFTNAFKDNDGNITIEVNDLNSDYGFSFIDYIDGTREILNKKGSQASNRSWWGNADRCVGKFHNLTKSNIANIAIIGVFDAVTLGGYSVGSVLVCAGYATALL
ncbi:hypothetical protein [Echinicola rosea]|uniref:Lipoprotein n=1 Tax=Echinicola rosea TaxID=1807691 RepID=A0ABQ1V449_9BACT|nr:hypothetical protein [Echinicola rosea]GGF35726.1 hypothetical protein GCM10011339_25150 [Echinicola rosea]